MDYKEKEDASHLIGKHYIIRNRHNIEYCVELTLIPIEEITSTKEILSRKRPVYKDLSTQVPPVEVQVKKDGKYKLFNGHRRLKSSMARGEKYIFARIYHKKSHKDLVLEAHENGENIPKEILDYYNIS